MVEGEALGGRGGRRSPTRHSTARGPPRAPPPARPVSRRQAMVAGAVLHAAPPPCMQGRPLCMQIALLERRLKQSVDGLPQPCEIMRCLETI